jgi:site-specific recombinase XerD
MRAFLDSLAASGADPQSWDISSLDEDAIKPFLQALKRYSAATESLYLAAARGFFEFLAAERLAAPNLPRLNDLIRKRARKQGRRLPQFPRAEIEKLIAYSQQLATISVEDAGENAKSEAAKAAERKRARLRNLRDRAFILLLADTGLRVSEACSLLVGDIDFLEARLTVTGKGDEQAAVRVSQRVLSALNDYLAARGLKSDGKTADTPALKTGARAGRRSGEKTKSLPVFVRHDRGAGSAAVQISPTPGERHTPERHMRKHAVPAPIAASTAWDFVRARAVEAVGEEAAVQIHPHSFRHYFVTVVLLATDNMEKARRLARHKNIATTQRYAEIDPELDQDYHEIFNT